MEKELIEELKKEFEGLAAQPPFNGKITYRTRPIFLARWKDLLARRGIKGQYYVDDLIKAMGKRVV